MAHSFTGKKRIRKSFGRIPEAVQMPNLIEVQRSSYEQFLQRETRSANRRQELLVGRTLNLDQVRHLHSFGDATE